jgi:Protein of unknown function (DUF1329)
MSQASASAVVSRDPAAKGAASTRKSPAAAPAPRAFLGFVLLLFLSGLARAAPAVFDPANYRSLAPSGTSETIEPGTQITLGNWQRYKRFLPFEIQVLYSGQYLWHIGGAPDFAITVGPTIDYTWPRRYLEDTEKYGDQTRLVKLDTGGYSIANYIAGLPFPIPTQPNLADKVVYNSRYGPNPTVFFWPWETIEIDRFLNVTAFEGNYESWRLSHLSVAGLPINPAYGKGYLSSQRTEVTAPEEDKYTIQLTLQPNDPTALSEQYFYLPQLRRSLRSSTGGRCTYEFASDSTTRDFSFDAANGTNALLGEAKILALEHATKDPAVLYSLDGLHVKSYLPGWPNPSLGRWELRNVYVVDSVPIPSSQLRACFSHTVTYFDKDNWLPLLTTDYDVDASCGRCTSM